MKATQFEFRHRVAIITLVYAVGFAAFWSFPLGSATHQTTWFVLSWLIASTHSFTLDGASIFVTATALCFGVAGTLLRVWGTAHLGAAAMTSSDLVAAHVIVSGPYRHLRNPLYLGLWLLSIPIIVLMPVAGAIFVLLVLAFFLLRIIGAEEAHLAKKLGEPYRAYCTRVPRFFPTALAREPRSRAQPQWVQALVAEAFPLAFTVCFALLAWRYNARLLTRSAMVCFGVSLVVRALMPPRRQ